MQHAVAMPIVLSRVQEALPAHRPWLATAEGAVLNGWSASRRSDRPCVSPVFEACAA
jgi:hypothetical protein